MGPFPLLMALGAHVVALDLPRPQIWARLLKEAKGARGKLTAPVKAKAGGFWGGGGQGSGGGWGGGGGGGWGWVGVGGGWGGVRGESQVRLVVCTLVRVQRVECEGRNQLSC